LTPLDDYFASLPWGAHTPPKLILHKFCAIASNSQAEGGWNDSPLRHGHLRVCLSAPWKGLGLPWAGREMMPTRQLTLLPEAAEAWLEAMKATKPLVPKAR